MLLALSVNSIESIESFIFYIIQYSISNLNAFIILISIGYSLYYVKTMFFDNHSYIYYNKLQNIKIPAFVLKKEKIVNKIYFNSEFALSSSFSITISILTLIILLFMFMPNEWLYMSNILSIIL